MQVGKQVGFEDSMPVGEKLKPEASRAKSCQESR